jgi:predicted RND superfamily exporter protein|tara:strand:- start:1462 stop:3900 length:2439 start_codon:yes stop_codon:yes gene_type:complete
MIDLIIKKPITILLTLIGLIAILSVHISNIDIDASADSLLLDSDPDLQFYREVHREYGSDEFVFVGYRPNTGLYTDASLDIIQELTEGLAQYADISAVTSIVNLPLLKQSYNDPETGAAGFRQIRDAETDISLAAEEFNTSPLYANNFVSLNASVTALKVDIKKNETLDLLIDEKYRLNQAISAEPKNKALKSQLDALEEQVLGQRAVTTQRYANVIAATRSMIAERKDSGEFYLAGAPLISNDIKLFVLSDVRTFGLSILGIMLIVLYAFFRRLSWVLLPLACASLNVLLVTGLIGWLNIQLTVISANFVALLIIFSITLAIHVIIRYQEVSVSGTSTDKLGEALRQIAVPCIYMILTSAIAFLSLLVSDIKPVINFGLIMIMGLVCAFIIAFTALPAMIKLIKPNVGTGEEKESSELLDKACNFVMARRRATSLTIFGLLAISIYGMTNITVENRFIDYFKSDTDIYKGLVAVDEELGGTVPLEVVLQAPPAVEDEASLDDEFGDYLDMEEEDNFTQQSYWYNRHGIAKVRQIHEYLEALPQVGSVLSIASTEEVFRTVNKGEELEDFHLAVVYKIVPDYIRDALISPYVSAEGSQTRVLARIVDSDNTLVRADLLKQIDEELNANYVADGESMRLSGITVLYNNVLQSLFRSQILTLGTVFVCILLMLIVLFRNIKLALIGTIPNVFTAFMILGMMGLFGIPLDIMTITIAAITIGVGVDFAIHYIHRFMHEMKTFADYPSAIKIVQTTVGKALYYTSITITLGFIVLVTSNFMPSIYFGLFTSIAMIVSLCATFTIIPLLLTSMRPIK